MEKYIYIVYIVSTSNSRYSQSFSCAGYYFDANLLERSMALTYSGLHWDCLTVLIYLQYLQDLGDVFSQVSATDIRKSIAVCFSDSRISSHQYLLYIIFSIGTRFRYLCFIISE